MIELRNIVKRFETHLAADNLSLLAATGQTTVLVGPSGCGKSTLLRLVNGLIRPDSGEVSFHGRPLSPETLLGVRRQIGYVIQDGGLFPHLTAEENVTIMARYLDWTSQAVKTRLDELCRLTRFPVEALARWPARLSGGQRQRVSLMRALMLEPRALLLDEPLGALDPMVRRDLQEDLRDIFRGLGTTVLLVTHDLHEAAYFADVIVLMNDGRIVQQGTMRDFTERPAEAFVTRFIEAQRRE